MALRGSKDQVKLRRTHKTVIKEFRIHGPIMAGPIWNICHNTLSANLNAGRAALIIRIKMYIYVAAVKLRRFDKTWFSFSLPGFEWVLVQPGAQKPINQSLSGFFVWTQIFKRQHYVASCQNLRSTDAIATTFEMNKIRL